MQSRTAILIATIILATPVLAGDAEQRTANSRSVVKQFAAKLKGELTGAMQQGGPLTAIGVCNTRAPEIAARASEDSGWRVGRTALKYRNPANAPDDWERAVLEDFEQRKAAGEDPQKLEYAAVVEQDGTSQFRYLKAIPTTELCLVCHGSNIPPDVVGQLDKLYPQDKARGFRAGDIRGAFTITQPM